MFKKDTFRLISKTFNRFFSLICIVFIGIAFMMGLLSTSTLMKQSVDVYDDEYNLQDIQLYSSYGFCKEDIEEIKKQEGIKDVYPSKMMDVYATNSKGDQLVSRVREINSSVNKINLVEGRMPEALNEVLVLSARSSSFNIGDTVTFSNDDGNLFDSLLFLKYTIVGKVESPEYICKFLSTSNLNNQELDIVFYLDSANFKNDYYTTIYLTLDGANTYNSFSNEYYDFVSEKQDELESFTHKQEKYLKEKLLVEYEEKIENGEKELEENRQKGQEELDKAKQQLDDANIKLIAGQLQIDTNKQTIDAAYKQMEDEKKALEISSKQVNEKIKEIENRTGKDFDDLFVEISGLYGTYTTLSAMKTDSAKDSYADIIQELNNENTRLNNEINDYQEIINNLDITDPDYEDNLNYYNALIESNRQEINNNIRIIENLNRMSSGTYDSSIDATLLAIDQKAISYGYSDINACFIELSSIQAEKTTYDLSYEALDREKELLDQSLIELEEGQKEITKGISEYKDGLKKYQEGIIEFNEKIEDGEIEIRKAKQDLQDLPDASWMILDRDEHYPSYMYKNTCKQMNAIGIVMPILFYLVAALVCMTTMTRLIDEQRGQIAIFKALGFSNKQIMGKYSVYAFLASVIGSVLGIPIGMALFPTVIYKTWRLLYELPPLKMSLPIIYLIICIFAFSLLMIIVTILVLKKTLDVSPAGLMRPKAPKNAKKVFLEYIPVLWDKLSFTSKITARNLIRYKARFFMTIIGVAGCTGLLVLGFGIKDSISDVVNVQYGEFFAYEHMVNLSDDKNIEEIIEILENDLDNEEVVPYMTYMSKVIKEDKDDVISAQVMNPRDLSKIMNLENKKNKELLKLDNKGVIISEKFAKNNDIKAGDIITIESKNGIRNDVKVNAISKMYFQHYMFISEDLYNDLFDETVRYSNIAVKGGDIENLNNNLENVKGVNSITDFEAFKSQFQVMIEALDIIILVIILTAGSLALVVLFNLTQVNISERIREIATLKVLGFRKGEVNSYLSKEILLLTVIGGLIGLPLGKIEEKFVMNVINLDMVMFSNNIKIGSYIYSYLITFVFTIIVLLFTRKPLEKIEMVESLKSVE